MQALSRQNPCSGSLARQSSEGFGSILFDYSLSISPNPFSSVAMISFSLPQTGNVSLKLYDVSGRLITVLDQGMLEEGPHTVEWNRSSVNAGIYFLRMETGPHSANFKLIVN